MSLCSLENHVKLRALAVLPKLEAWLVKLKTYTGERLRVKGMVHVTVTHENGSPVLPLIVLAGSRPNLLGMSWLKELAMEMHPVHQFESFLQGDPASNNQLEQLLRKHVAVFKEELGTLKGRPPQGSGSQAKVLKLRSDRMPVTHSEWAATRVPILKTYRGIHICGDYKVTVNQVSSAEQYPIP